MDSGGLEEPCITWGALGADPPCEGAIIMEKDMPGHAGRQSAVSCAEWLNRSICRLGSGLGLGRRKHKVQSYSPGVANVPSWEDTLTPPGELD